MMNEINKIKFKENNNNNNIYEINTDKYNDLKKEYERYIENISKIFKNIIRKCKEIILLINNNNNNKINISDNINFSNANEISNIIFDILTIIENYVKNQKNNFSIIERDNNNFTLNNDIIIGNEVNKEKKEEIKKPFPAENGQKSEEVLDSEMLYKTDDGRIIFRNGLLRGIIHK